MTETVTVYLAGPITHAPDHGHDWRDWISAEYPEIGWRNPLDQYDAHAADVDVVYTDARIDEGNRVSTRSIVGHDKELIDQSDAILVYWPGYQSDGTAMEMCYADCHDTPIVVVSEMSAEDLSIWVYHHASRIVESFDAGVTAIMEVCQ